MFENICKNLKIIELASVLAGPSVGAFFAEFGACVTKIENIKTNGDVTRSWKTADEKDSSNLSSYFVSTNFGKRSLALDLTTPEGKTIVYKLTKSADIVISSYKKDDDVKLGVSYEKLSKINPSIIYGHITGYGESSERTGYDAIIQAESGYMSINGDPHSSPCKLPVALMDVLAGHQLKEAILLALLQRIHTKEGCYIPISLFDSALSGLVNQSSNYLNTGINPQPMGSDHPNIVPYGTVFDCKDGKKIILAIGNDKQFSLLIDVLKIDLDIELYKTNSLRIKNKNILIPLLSSRLKEVNSQSLLKELNELKVPAGHVNTIKDALNLTTSEQMIIKSDVFRATKQSAISTIEKPSSPPQYGQHTIEVLTELKYTKNEIDDLKKNGIIQCSK